MTTDRTVRGWDHVVFSSSRQTLLKVWSCTHCTVSHALSDKCRVCWETSSPRSSPPLVEYAGMPAVSSDILRDYRTRFLWQKTVLVWRSVQSCAFHPFQVFSSKVWIGTSERSSAAWLVFVYGQVLFLNSICRLPIWIKKGCKYLKYVFRCSFCRRNSLALVSTMNTDIIGIKKNYLLFYFLVSFRGEKSKHETSGHQNKRLRRVWVTMDIVGGQQELSRFLGQPAENH